MRFTTNGIAASPTFAERPAASGIDPRLLPLQTDSQPGGEWLQEAANAVLCPHVAML
jgi:hypothetical protein